MGDGIVRDIIVIGGGPAGVTAALRARELGADVALVERRDRLGGTCTNDGCVPLRVWARAARLLRDAEQFAGYGLGLHPAGGAATTVRLDFPALQARTREAVGRAHGKKRLREHLEEVGVAVRLGAGDAAFADARSIRLSGTGETLRARSFVLCAGGHARKPPFEGAELCLGPTGVWALEQLPRSVVIVGAAATGCQLASIFRAFGSEVTLLDTAPRVLPGEDAAVSEAVTAAFTRHGVRVAAGIGGVRRVERRGDGRFRVVYAPGGASGADVTVEAADAVVASIGWPGNVEGLNLEAAGVGTERGFVVVDDALRTSAPHVFAAGDITGRAQLVQSAGDEGRVAAENALHCGADGDAPHRIVPHGGFTDPEYGSVGLTEAKARERHGEDAVAAATVPYADLDRALIDGRGDGLCKLVVARGSREVLGAHVVGEQALEVVHAVAAGMAAGMRVDQLADLEIAYPTFTGILGLAARHLCREMGVACRTASDAPPPRAALGHPRATEWERRDEASSF